MKYIALIIALLFVSSAEAGWTEAITYNGPNCDGLHFVTSDNSELLNWIGNVTQPVSYRYSYGGNYGPCIKVNQFGGTVFLDKGCPASSCYSEASAKNYARAWLESQHNCSGQQCTLRGDTTYFIDIMTVDFPNCELRHYEVILRPKERWTWVFSTVPQYSFTSSIMHCDESLCGPPW